MTDRELLELAAKAAGLEFDPTAKTAHGLMVVRDGAVCQSDQVLWNPLSDDGDALRLAVKLELLVDIETCYHVIACKELMACVEHIGNDGNGCIYAATRRAIVRAAAEIGKGMK